MFSTTLGCLQLKLERMGSKNWNKNGWKIGHKEVEKCMWIDLSDEQKRWSSPKIDFSRGTFKSQVGKMMCLVDTVRLSPATAVISWWDSRTNGPWWSEWKLFMGSEIWLTLHKAYLLGHCWVLYLLAAETSWVSGVAQSQGEAPPPDGRWFLWHFSHGCAFPAQCSCQNNPLWTYPQGGDPQGNASDRETHVTATEMQQ